jgi:hypothetical protein
MSSKIHQVDENYIKSIYKEINEHIEDYQKDFNKDSEAFDSWSKTICNPKYKLIKNLVYLLEQNETTFHDKQIIFSIFNQLLIINQNVGNQLKKFKYLPKILVEYLLQFKQDNKKIDLCAVSTLSYSFNIEEYKNLLSIELIEIIFDSLIKVKEENVIQNLIRIFIEINYIYKDIKDLKSNLFLKVYNINEHSNLVPEIALRLLNQEKDNEFIIKILFCIKSLMDIKNKDVFYSKDLEAFIDIAVNFLESTEINEIRCGIIDIIYNITRFDEFYNIKYKNSEIKDLLEDCINSDKVTQEIKEKSQKILENIDKKMNNK